MNTALSVGDNLLPSAFDTPTAVASSIIDYFAQPEEYKEEQVVFDRDGNPETREVVRYRPVPMIEEWCAMHRITKRRLADAAEAYPEIAEAIEFARGVIKVALVRGGLVERYNPAMAKFVATNETDMVDRSEHVNKNLNANAATILDEIEKASKPIRRQA